MGGGGAIKTIGHISLIFASCTPQNPMEPLYAPHVRSPPIRNPLLDPVYNPHSPYYYWVAVKELS